jgi:thymidylate synthase (FAD)
MEKIEKGYSIPVLNSGFVRYVDHMGTDQRITEAARISYHSPSKGDEADKKLLHRLYKDRHTSPFEMCKITFDIKMPIFVMRQFVRHRMQNLNEVSARYTELPDDFYIPNQWRAQDTKNKQHSTPDWGPGGPPLDWRNNIGDASTMLETACHDAYKLYKEMLSVGIAREMARLILPVNIYTEVYCCWDLKNLLHFFSLRDDPHAQWEHQEYGRAMKAIAAELFPWTMEAYEKFKFVPKEEV